MQPSCGSTCQHARRQFFAPKLQYLLRFKYICTNIQAKQIINSLLFNHFYPVIYRRDQKRKRNGIVYTVSVSRYGPRTG